MKHVLVSLMALMLLAGCNSTSNAPKLSASQQAEQDRRYDAVGADILAALATAGGCMTKDQIQSQVVEAQTGSRQEALVVTLIVTNRLSKQGKANVQGNSVSLPGKKGCA